MKRVLRNFKVKEHHKFGRKGLIISLIISGLSEDMENNAQKWKFLHESKEPDNLPLPEPWHSRLNRFQKLVFKFYAFMVLKTI